MPRQKDPGREAAKYVKVLLPEPVIADLDARVDERRAQGFRVKCDRSMIVLEALVAYLKKGRKREAAEDLTTESEQSDAALVELKAVELLLRSRPCDREIADQLHARSM